MIDVVTISSKGQVVIPKKIREDAGLVKQDQVLILSDQGKVVIEKISKEKARKDLRKFLEVIGKRSGELNITEKDIKKEIREMRNEKKSGYRH